MKIIKDTSRQMKRHKFVCDKCKSVFIADVGEYQLLDKNGDPANDVYVYAKQIACQCPVCLHYVCEDLNKKNKKKKKHHLISIDIKNTGVLAALAGFSFIVSGALGGWSLGLGTCAGITFGICLLLVAFFSLVMFVLILGDRL